ncbi:MAG: 1-acyl-sn-glycerol-3-phosphate acyltransferase [Acidobacteriota bacterium]|nr:1-acyl-sn-glycerol-3-phosphate acyltransferase [Acidobacteriota bacterium]
MGATLALLFTYITLGTVAGVIGIPYSMLVGDISRLYRIGMGITRLGLRAARVRVRIEGLEQVPADRACIFMCNHVSNLDPPVVMPLIPGRSSVLLKKELMRIPVLGYAMHMAKFVPVERGSRREAAKASVNAAADCLRSGLHILVFPEGTRSPNGRLSTFKKGPFYLAQETSAPIIPVAIAGTESMMQKGSLAIRPGVAQVRFLPVVESSQYATREQLMQAVRESIAAALPPSMQPAE